MIVAVEGPSAAGKTTWCRRHAASCIPEYAPTGREPDGADPLAHARYWTDVNARRWALANEREARDGLAICDTDPLKLHYSWSLAQIGAAPRARFDQELVAVRHACAAGRLGFADLVLVSIPAPPVLRAHRDADATRTRRAFELHARLAEPLRAWYRAVDELEPGRVLWELPSDGLPGSLPAPRIRRSDTALLDRLVAALP